MTNPEHLSVALDLRVEIDRLLKLHESLGSNFDRQEYQEPVGNVLQALAAIEATALHRHHRGYMRGL